MYVFYVKWNIWLSFVHVCKNLAPLLQRKVFTGEIFLFMSICWPSSHTVLRILVSGAWHVCRGHFSARKIAAKILQCGFYWPFHVRDAHLYCKSCAKCQNLGRLSCRDETHLTPIIFNVWDIDFMGSFSIPTDLNTFSLLLTMSPNGLTSFLIGRMTNMLSSNSSKSPSLHVLEFPVLSLATTHHIFAIKLLNTSWKRMVSLTRFLSLTILKSVAKSKFSIITSSKFLIKWLVTVRRIGPRASLTLFVLTELPLKLQLGCHRIIWSMVTLSSPCWTWASRLLGYQMP